MKFGLIFQTSSDTELGLGMVKIVTKAQKLLFMCMTKMETLAINYCPVNTGMLRSSIHLTPDTEGHDEYFLRDGVYYGEYVEYGTSPHTPPIQPLKDWSRLVLGDENLAWAIRAKISKKGTKSQPFFRPALHEVQTVWYPEYMRQVFG